MNTLKTTRISSIDLLRGLIMIVMALDHTRDYFHADAYLFDPLDLQKTNVILFFTRWITHFCAPIFILLAGTSAFISGQRKTKKELASFLLKRGLWLIILELTIVNFAWFFNPGFQLILLAVIWIIGVSMIFLAGFIFLPRKVIFSIGILLIAGHNLLDHTHFPYHTATGFVWGLLHDQKIFLFGNTTIMEAYQIIPWIGVMALGYCLGSLYAKGFDASKRKRILLRTGIVSILLFIIIRAINVYGNQEVWSTQRSPVFSLLSFLNISKYPPSLDYLLLTEGFALIFLALTENISNRITNIISVYGRVPMFFYLLHLYVIHLAAMLAAVLTGFKWTDMAFFYRWTTSMPTLKGYGFSLGVVYLVWIAVVVVLYPLCKIYDQYKSAHKEKWWLGYL
jgi:uncharacterized membrane protein